MSSIESEEDQWRTAFFEVDATKEDFDSDDESFTEYLLSSIPDFALDSNTEEEDWPLGADGSVLVPAQLYHETIAKIDLGKSRQLYLQGRLDRLHDLEAGKVSESKKESAMDIIPPRAFKLILDTTARLNQLKVELKKKEDAFEARKQALNDKLSDIQARHRQALTELTELKAEVLATEFMFRSRREVLEALLQERRNKKWKLRLELEGR